MHRITSFTLGACCLALLLFSCDPNGDGRYSVCPDGKIAVDYTDRTEPVIGIDYSILHHHADGSVTSSYHRYDGTDVYAEEGDIITVYPFVRDPESGVQFAQATISGEYACASDVDIYRVHRIDHEIMAGYYEGPNPDCSVAEAPLSSYEFTFGEGCEPVGGRTGQGTYFITLEARNHATGITLLTLMRVTNEANPPDGPIILF